MTPIDRGLRALMKQAGIKTFKDLADATSITYVGLHYYRKGQRKPSLDAASRLSQALHVTTDEIIRLFMK